MRFGKVLDPREPRKRSDPGTQLVGQGTRQKIVLVQNIPSWVNIGDTIPFQVTAETEKSIDYGRFIDKTFYGSIVSVGSCPTIYERYKPTGVYFQVLGFGDLFDSVDEAFEPFRQPSDEFDYITASRKVEAKIGTVGFIMGHRKDPGFIDSSLQKLLELYMMKSGSECRANFFIDSTVLPADQYFIAKDKAAMQGFNVDLQCRLKHVLLRDVHREYTPLGAIQDIQAVLEKLDGIKDKNRNVVLFADWAEKPVPSSELMGVQLPGDISGIEWDKLRNQLFKGLESRGYNPLLARLAPAEDTPIGGGFPITAERIREMHQQGIYSINTRVFHVMPRAYSCIRFS